MMSKKVSSFVCLTLLGLFFINSAYANLMIAPQRIVLEERERSASVNLINTASTRTTYRLHWVQKKQKPNGQYIDLPSNSNEIPNASSMLRFSPRQVTLEPGEKQTIRIAVRRHKNMTHGEYRSHLLFQALPNQDTEASSGKGAKIKINLLLGFAIPVIVRQGKLNGTAKVANVEIKKTVQKGKAFYGALITLKRGGSHTAYGSLKVMWKPRLTSAYKQVAILNNVALYPESNTIQYQAGLKDFKPNNGYIKVIYEGRKEYEGKTFDYLEAKLNTQQITTTKLD